MGAQTFTRTTATEWVCVDCHLAVAGYGPGDTGEPEHTVTLYSDPSVESIDNGSPIEDCDTPECVEAARAIAAGEWAESNAYDLHAECDHDSFSLHSCAGCGSTLAGDRYAVTVSYLEWDDTAPFVATVSGTTRAMAAGHAQRHGHALTGFYVTRDGIATLERTCCGEWA